MLYAIANEDFVAGNVANFSHNANHDSSRIRRQQNYWIQWVSRILTLKFVQIYESESVGTQYLDYRGKTFSVMWRDPDLFQRLTMLCRAVT